MGAKVDRFSASANEYAKANGNADLVIESPTGAEGAAIGGLFSTAGKEVLQSYNAKTNSWNLKERLGHIVVLGLFDGAATGYITQAITASGLESDPSRGIWDGPHSPGILDFFTEKWPEVVGFGYGFANTVLWRYLVIPRH